MFRFNRCWLQTLAPLAAFSQSRLRQGAAVLAVALLGSTAAQAAEVVNAVDRLAPLPVRELGQIAGGARPATTSSPPTGVPRVAVILWDEAGKRGHQGVSGSLDITQIASGQLILKTPSTR